jgi:uncharacterized RDD family membrane protein YckC
VLQRMKNFVDKCQPADLIALVIIAGGFWLKLRGGDGVTTALLTAISFYYFGHKISQTKAPSDAQKIIDTKN